MKVLPSCPHVYFKRCKGWWANTDQAERCPLRREQSAE